LIGTKIGEVFEDKPILFVNKIFHVTTLTFLTFAINLWHQKFITADITAAFVNNQHAIQRQRNKILMKSLYLKGYTATRLTDEFPEKSWTKCGVNKLLKKLQDTGIVDRRPGSGRPHSARTEENNYTFVRLNISNILLTHKYTQHTQLHAKMN